MRAAAPLTRLPSLCLENVAVLAVPESAALLVEQVRQSSLLVLVGHVIM